MNNNNKRTIIDRKKDLGHIEITPMIVGKYLTKSEIKWELHIKKLKFSAKCILFPAEKTNLKSVLFVPLILYIPIFYG